MARATIVNDMPYAVETMLCSKDDCGKPGFPFFFEDRYNRQETLKPGEADEYINIPTDGVAQVYRLVRVSDEQELGCLPLVLPRPGPRIVARVSQHIPCRGD